MSTLPDQILIELSGPLCIDVWVRDGDGRTVDGVTAVTVTYRAREAGEVVVEAVDLDAPAVDGELPVLRRTYEVDFDGPVSASIPALAWAVQPVVV